MARLARCTLLAVVVSWWAAGTALAQGGEAAAGGLLEALHVEPLA